MTAPTTGTSTHHIAARPRRVKTRSYVRFTRYPGSRRSAGAPTSAPAGGDPQSFQAGDELGIIVVELGLGDVAGGHPGAQFLGLGSILRARQLPPHTQLRLPDH